MTQKTIEELALEKYPDEKGVDALVKNLRHLNRKAFIAGYNEALKTKWVELPELPTETDCYLCTLESLRDKGRYRGFESFHKETGRFQVDETVEKVIAWMYTPPLFIKETT